MGFYPKTISRDTPLSPVAVLPVETTWRIEEFFKWGQMKFPSLVQGQGPGSECGRRSPSEAEEKC